MNKYNNSKIYKIESNVEPKYYYIGSTITDLNIRLNRHKADSKVHPDTKKNKYFNSINWNVEIMLIAEVNVSNSNELHIFENNFIKQFLNNNLCLNTYHSIINKEIRKQKINEYSKKYYNEHVDELRKKHNDYYLETKDEKLKNYEENKEMINQKRREKNLCDCGITISKGYYSAHNKSKCHIDGVMNKNNYKPSS